MLSEYGEKLSQNGWRFLNSYSFVIAIAAIAALNEELDRSPHAITPIFFARTNRRNEESEVRQNLCKGLLVTLHLVVIARWCERDLTEGMQHPSGTRFATATRIGLLLLCVSSSFVVWGDVLLGESDAAEISRSALIAFNSLGALFCLCTTIMLSNLASLIYRRLSSPILADSPKRALRRSAAKCLVAALLAAAQVEFCGLGPVVTERRLAMAGLPAHLDGFRIVHLSDLHIGPTCRRACVAAMVDAAVALRADLFAVTGDVIDGAAAPHRAAAAPLARLRSHAPAVMVTVRAELGPATGPAARARRHPTTARALLLLKSSRPRGPGASRVGAVAACQRRRCGV